MVSMSEEQLNGSRRVLLDKVVSADECRQLQRLSNVSRDLGSSGSSCSPALGGAVRPPRLLSCSFMTLFLPSQAAALRGDGYRGTPSPHSPGEMFQGVTVLKALKVCT